MKYLCLVYAEEEALEALSGRDAATLTHDSMAYDDVLRRSGHLIVAHALEPVRTAATVRVRRRKAMVIDGPFAETKEQLVGFILIDAQDRADAIDVASRIPLARLGSIEVRPIRSRSSERNSTTA